MATFLPKPLEELTLWDPSGKCVRYTSEGHPYEELSCLYPSIGWTYFEFEKNFDTVPIHSWIKTNRWFLPVAVTGYCLMLYFGQKYFKERKPWNWRKALVAWNLLLTVFSVIGFFRTAPALLHGIVSIKGWDWICSAPENTFLAGSCGLWAELWVISKFPEFLDTFFLIIHKKKIIFLHPFHHVVTFAGSFWALQKSSPPLCALGIVMNYGVHSIMYFYYMLMAMRCKPKWFNPFWVTAAQLAQMLVGIVGSIIAVYYYPGMPDDCKDWLKAEMPLTIATYTAFGVLFARLFFTRYFSIDFTMGGKKGPKAKRKTA